MNIILKDGDTVTVGESITVSITTYTWDELQLDPEEMKLNIFQKDASGDPQKMKHYSDLPLIVAGVIQTSSSDDYDIIKVVGGEFDVRWNTKVFPPGDYLVNLEGQVDEFTQFNKSVSVTLKAVG